MRRPSGVFFVVATSLLSVAGAASAQPASQPTANAVSQQFKSGAARVGDGATQIGQGVRLGAIMTWNAFRQGAASFVAGFKGADASASQPSR